MSGFDYHGFNWPGGPEYEPPPPLRCTTCGQFIRLRPDEIEVVPYTGPVEPFEEGMATPDFPTQRILKTKCAKGHTTIETDY